MKRYEQGSVGMRPDPEGAWCEYSAVRRLYERVLAQKRDDEIERLQTRVNSLETALANAVNADWHNAEIERLRKQVLDDDTRIADTEIVRKRDAEIERLRELLWEAEKMWPNPGLSSESASWYRRVREALGKK